MDIPHKAHVLVLDGRRLLLFNNEGSPAEPRLKIVTHRDQDSAPTHAQGADRPGKTHASIGGAHSSYEQTDFHQQDEDGFVADAAALLKAEIDAGHIEALIVVAAPRALGELRKYYGAEIEKRLVGEIPKDVAGRATEDIAATIAAS